MQRMKQLDSLAGFVNSFKQFEKRLEKLQDDVSFHGNTLYELRMMIANLAVAVNSDSKHDGVLQPHKKTIGVQYEVRMMEHKRRPDAMQPFRNTLKIKTGADRKFRNIKITDAALQKKKTPGNSKHRRPHKAEAPRKATTLRPQKTTDKKRVKTK